MYDKYKFKNDHFEYELFINEYFKNDYGFNPNGITLQSNVYTGTFELVKKCSVNKVVLDIGANHGLFAIPCALYGYKVIGFEPVKINYDSLKMAKDINNCSTLQIVEQALFNETKESIIYVPNCSDNSSLNPSVAVAHMKNKNYIEEKILCIKFDDWESDFDKKNIGFIKMDVQGFEYPVVEGMHNFLSNATDLYLFLEWDDRLTSVAGYSLNDLYTNLINYGFQELPCFYRDDKLFYKP
jgi:FkbM family methyltransferase